MGSKIVAITGASAGIGAAVAKRFVAGGDQVVLLARREDKLKSLQKELGSGHIYPLDITSKADVVEVFGKIQQEVGAIDVLVNNAGLALGLDPAQESNLADWEKCIDVNINGLVYCTHALLSKMVERDSGHIVNLGSTAGNFVYAGGAIYCATKAFVHQFSMGLRCDLVGTNVRVSCIQPGLVGGTEFSNTRFRGDEAKAKGVYEGTQPLMPEDIADVIYFTVHLPSHVNLNRVELMPTCQACGPLTVKKSS